MTSLIPLLLTGMLLGQPGPGMGPRAGGPPGGRQAGPPADITPFMDRVAEAVNATPEQIEQLQAIAAEHKTAAQAARTARHEQLKANEEQLRTLREQMREARQAGEEQKVTELRQQMRELMGSPPGDLMRQTHAKITGILTAEQKTAFEEFLAKDRPGVRERAGRPGPPRGPQGQEPNIYRFVDRVIEAVDATEEQRGQLRAIAADHIRAMKAAEADRAIALQSNREQIEALRRQVREAHREGNTEQARTLRKQLDDLTGTPMADVLKATQEKIAGILTAEQKVKFDALVQDARGGRGPRSAGDRPGYRAGKAERAGKQQGAPGREGGKRGRHGPPPPPPAESDGAE